MRKKRMAIFGLIALLAMALVGNLTAVEYISVGTGNIGGVYYAVGGGIAELINKYVPNVSARAEVTGASVENCRLAGRDEIQFGISNADIVYYAYNGMEPFTEKHDIRAGFALYSSTVNIVVRAAANVNSIRDLKGKRISVGAIGSNTYNVAERILEAHGLRMADIRATYNSINEAADAMRDGHLDGAFVLAATPAAALSELAITTDVKFIPLEEAAINSLIEKYPFYSRGVIPAGSYRGVDSDVYGIRQWNVLLCSAKMSNEVAYQVTKAVFEHLDELVEIHPAAKEISLETAVEVPIPFHPGVEKYFREVGALR